MNELEFDFQTVEQYADVSVNFKLVKPEEISQQDYILVLAQSILLLDENGKENLQETVLDDIQYNAKQLYIKVEKASRRNVFSEDKLNLDEIKVDERNIKSD